jgi:hypothetical protein
VVDVLDDELVVEDLVELRLEVALLEAHPGADEHVAIR